MIVRGPAPTPPRGARSGSVQPVEVNGARVECLQPVALVSRPRCGTHLVWNLGVWWCPCCGEPRWEGIVCD